MGLSTKLFILSLLLRHQLCGACSHDRLFLVSSLVAYCNCGSDSICPEHSLTHGDAISHKRPLFCSAGPGSWLRRTLAECLSFLWLGTCISPPSLSASFCGMKGQTYTSSKHLLILTYQTSGKSAQSVQK